MGRGRRKYSSLQKPYITRKLEWEILAMFEDGPLTLYDINTRALVPKQRVAWALGRLIAKGHVVPVRDGGSLHFERVPGSLIEWILEHEV